MARYRLSKLGFNITSKITTPKPLFRNPQTIINHTNHSGKFTSTGSGYRYYHAGRHKDKVVIFTSIVMYLGLCSGVVICLGHSEIIPYSKRKHFMLISGKIETWIGKLSFEKMKYEYKEKGKVLRDTHPKSVRVRKILKDVTEALQTGLNEQELNCGHADKAVKLGISHAKGLEWKVMVVKSNDVNAWCLPGGKIIVFTGLLERFKTDEELATIIGHEVAHAVARHAAEILTTSICFAIGRVILDGYVHRDVVSVSYLFLLNLPFSRKMESEADHIGLMLMASAGYNPRVAPKVFEKLDEGSGDSALDKYLSTHPSGNDRSKLLSEASVMQKAISVYEETIARREVDT